MDHNVTGNGERDGEKTKGIGQSATKSRNRFLIYKLTNTVNGKSYIGVTGRTEPERWSEHVQRARQGVRNSRLYSAIRRYGESAFVRETLACATSEDAARDLEVILIEQHGTFLEGYNSNPGGHGFLEFPEHIKAKISAGQKGKIIGPETRAKMSAAKIGKPVCAKHLGEHVRQGDQNPRARSFRVRFPSGDERIVCGIRAFVRDHGLSMRHLKERGHSKGFRLLERLNDQGASPYTQAGGKSGLRESGENMVSSALKDAAAA